MANQNRSTCPHDVIHVRCHGRDHVRITTQLSSLNFVFSPCFWLFHCTNDAQDLATTLNIHRLEKGHILDYTIQLQESDIRSEEKNSHVHIYIKLFLLKFQLYLTAGNGLLHYAGVIRCRYRFLCTVFWQWTMIQSIPASEAIHKYWERQFCG
jgi:hypothetical protein